MSVQGRINAYEQKDSRSDEDLAYNVERPAGLALRDCNAKSESRATGHAESKAQYRVEELLAIRMEQPGGRRRG